MVILLDAENVFHHVKWQYLIFTPKALGFKDSFISWIKLLYFQAVATVFTNGQQSKYFSLAEVHVRGLAYLPYFLKMPSNL